MRLERFQTPGLAQVAYIVADAERRVAAVIDPRRDIGEYLAWISGQRYDVVAILETHIHADFVSGARELAAATGAPTYAGRLGESAIVHRPLDDGDVIWVGSLKLKSFWTPGHTPEHISFLLFDPARGEQPVALFSGDALFAGEVGRPDLLGADKTGVLVDQLYDTVFERLAKLPDDVVVYPGHGAGAPCGKQIGDAAQTTIGQEKRFNYAFQADTREAFIRAVMAGMPKPPACYPVLKRLNKTGPGLLQDIPAGEPLSPKDVESLRDSGALLIDTRPLDEFAAAHVPGFINVGLGASFATWACWLMPYDRQVVLILLDDDRYDGALIELRRIGIDHVAGYLRGGISGWIASGHAAATIDAMSVHELAALVGGPSSGMNVLDVRDHPEWEHGHIAGARNIPAGDIARGEPPGFAEDEPIAVVCGSGYRSSLVASLLLGRGRQGVITVPGGMSAWMEAGLPTV